MPRLVPAGTAVVTPVLLEDFSTYTNTANLLADPRGIYATVEAKNTTNIVLDTAVGLAPSTQSMRYDFPNNGSVALDYSITPGFLKIPGALTEVFVEYVVRFSSNFAVNAGAPGGQEYKLAAMSDYTSPGVNGRWNIAEMQASKFVMGWPDAVTDATGGLAPSTLWNNANHTMRVHAKLSPSGTVGTLQFWVDGVSDYSNVAGFNTDATNLVISAFAPGLNLNQGPNVDNMKLWWLKIAVYDTNPGW